MTSSLFTHLRDGVACCAAAILAPTAAAQLSPCQAYNGINRPLKMTARWEDSASIDPANHGEPAAVAQIQLLEPATWKVLESAPLGTAGPFDLITLFPDLWTRPAVRARLLYAQLTIGTRKLGPPVVLQPMLSPPYAARLDRSGAPTFPPEKDAPRVYSGIRAYVDQNVELDTSKGRIVIALRPDAAPNTCWAFRELVSGGLYTDIIIHRIASLAGKPEADIIQTGDPNGNGQGGSGQLFDLEPSTLPHDFGVVSMARFGDPNSASSQFMIGLNREGTAYLDRKYSSFGVIIAGADVLRAIGSVAVGADNRPKDPPVIKSAKLTDAAPAGETPPPAPDPTRKSGGR